MAIGTAISTALDWRKSRVSKQAWGTKRQCPDCGARFYDLNKDPIICPKCQKVYEPEASKPARRSRPAPVAKKPVPADLDVPEVEVPGDLEEVGEEEEEVLEDTSELGEDDDDVAEVIEKVDEGEER
jgi:uncharacterized protein (TIGR02300 family)